MVPSEDIQSSRPAVSVVVPAFNEAGNITGTIRSIEEVLEDMFTEYEVIIVDDGSTDGTGTVAARLAESDSHVRALHNDQNMGCGFTFLRGVRASRYEYVWLIPGDGEIGTDAIKTIAGHIGAADIIMPYVLNFRTRPLSRRIMSWGYTVLINVLFGMRMHYYTGPCAIRKELVSAPIPVDTRGFAFMAPMLVGPLRHKRSFIEAGIFLQPRVYGSPSVNSALNVLSGAKTLAQLFWALRIAGRAKPTEESMPTEST